MLYELLGPLLGTAAARLAERGDTAAGDAFARKELRRVALLMRRIGGAWPSLFEGLEAENRILEHAVADASAALAEHGEVLPAGDPWGEADPLARRRLLLRVLDEAVVGLHAGAEPWRRAGLARVRRRLAEAAEIQRRVLEGEPLSSGDSGSEGA